MEKYEQISVIGEGSYGLVMKCRHRETNQFVAVKKFLETEEDEAVKRITVREIRILKRLRHENLVTLIEVFRHKKRFYLVFEFLEWTVLDELDRMPSGLGEEKSKERIFQVLRAISYCHRNHVIHRDVKPENVLISSKGVVKLCDFGFARTVNASDETCTEYVATRWYRAPELLLGERTYGTGVDIWAIGCLFAEMMTGDPLFPGESDIDQLYLIIKLLGKPCYRHRKLLAKIAQLKDLIKITTDDNGLERKFSSWSIHAIDFLTSCMQMDPEHRQSADALLKHTYFVQDNFSQRCLEALKEKIETEFNNPLLHKFKPDMSLTNLKKDEVKNRKVLHNNIKRSLNLSERNLKRKFHSITLHNNINVIIPRRTRIGIIDSNILTRGSVSGNKHFNHIDTLKSSKPNSPILNASSSPSENHITEDKPIHTKTILSSKTNLIGTLEDHKKDMADSTEIKQSSHSFKVNQHIGKSRSKESTSHSNLGKLPLPTISFEFTGNETRDRNNGLEYQSQDYRVTSAYRYGKAKRRRNTLDISLPYVVSGYI